MAYNGTTEVASGLKPMGAGGFPVVDAADVRVTDTKRLNAALAEKIDKPTSGVSEGDVLRINSSGNPAWAAAAAPTDSQVGAAVEDWLDDHPEATTTVEDGAVSYDKLDTNLKGHMDAVTSTEASTTASQEHAAGSYFMLSGTLYKAIDDIASGAEIVTSGEGQNCADVPNGLSGEVSNLRSVLTDVETVISQDEQKLKRKATAIINTTEESEQRVLLLDAADSPLYDLSVEYLPRQEDLNPDDNQRHIRLADRLLIAMTGKNLLGSTAMANFFLTHNSGALSSDWIPNERRLYFSSGRVVALKNTPLIENIFKPDTQYTFILTIMTSSTQASNLYVRYEDGTATRIPFTGTTEKITKVFTTDNGKTVRGLMFSQHTGSLTVYVDECGVFEGGVSADSFVPFNGTIAEPALPSGQTLIAGEWWPLTGRVVSTWGYIESYNGETLPGAWISSMDEYVEGETPTTGAEVAYELSAPEEYGVTRVTLDTKIGENWIYSEERFGRTLIGDVVYQVDMQAYVENTANRINSAEMYNPDLFEGTDAQKLNQAFEALENVGGNICINREYTCDANLIINNNSNNRKFIHVFGIGEHAKINLQGNTVTTTGTGPHAYGGVYFHNLTFTGSGDTAYGFNAGRLIRLFFSQCHFNGFIRAFYATGSTGYMQTLYLSQCGFKGPEAGTAIYIGKSTNGAYNIGIYQCLFENLEYGIYQDSGAGGMKGVRIDDTLIENISKAGIYIGGVATNMTVANCHFEICHPHIYVSDKAHRSLSILNNYFIASNCDSIIITPTTSNVQDRVMGIIQGNYHDFSPSTGQWSSGLVNFATLSYDEDSGNAQIATSIPQKYQPWVIRENSTTNEQIDYVKNGGTRVVGSGNTLSDESKLDGNLLDGAYSIFGTQIIALVFSAPTARVQLKFKKNPGEENTVFTYRTQSISSGNWTPWSEG